MISHSTTAYDHLWEREGEEDDELYMRVMLNCVQTQGGGVTLAIVYMYVLHTFV